MIELQSKTVVPGLKAGQVIEFLLRCNDAAYQRWWPGTHLHLHTLRPQPGDIGSILYMDEWIGQHRLRSKAVVTEFVPGRRLTVQAGARLRLPIHLVLDFEDDEESVHITHTVRAGFEGPGRILDPLLRLYLSPGFVSALDAHVHEEFARLGALLATQARERAEA